VLAAVVLTAIYGLLDFPALLHMWRVSRLDFYASVIALGAVLALGILNGILLAALASILLLLMSVSRPHVALLGRIPGTHTYSDMDRHPENEPLSGVIAFRPEASLIGNYYESNPVKADMVVVAPDSWIFAGTGLVAGDRFGQLVQNEYDRVTPEEEPADGDEGRTP